MRYELNQMYVEIVNGLEENGQSLSDLKFIVRDLEKATTNQCEYLFYITFFLQPPFAVLNNLPFSV